MILSGRQLKIRNPKICANTMITLIKIAIYLLDRQINALEKRFIEEGGIRERMLKARLNYRNKDNMSH